MNYTSFTAAAVAALLSAGAVNGSQAASPFEASAKVIRLEPGQTIADSLRLAGVLHNRALLQTNSRQTKSENSTRASAVPVLTGGTVVSPTLVVGQANSFPTLQFSFKTGRSGLRGVNFQFVSPNGQTVITTGYQPREYTTGGTVTFTPPVNAPYYAQPGVWTLSTVTVDDFLGNSSTYSAAQIAALFNSSSITVVNNGPVDTTPPVVTAGQVVTPTVSQSSPVPFFQASLTGSDNLSGIFLAFVYVQPPGSPFSYADFFTVPVPVLSGTVQAYAPVPQGSPTGTWNITGYALCDVAGNCFSDENSSDIQNLFGTTTFTVTN